MDLTTPDKPANDAGAAKNRITLSLDPRIIIALLLLVIVGMLAAWRPRSDNAATGNNARTVTVTGEAKLKAEPDEFVFYPSYTIQNSDRDAALAEMTKKSDVVVAKLKELGVKDGQIKTNADSYDRGGVAYPVAPDRPGIEPVPSYTLQLTVTVASRDMAQKIQDYLNTTSPTGTITPGTSFSDAKRKELESKARDEATKDARAKADQSARNLGFKVGKVKSVNDGSGFSAMPYATRELAFDSGASSAPQPPKLSVQPGENELNYSVTVEYFVK